jgi:hypothetical protein
MQAENAKKEGAKFGAWGGRLTPNGIMVCHLSVMKNNHPVYAKVGAEIPERAAPTAAVEK